MATPLVSIIWVNYNSSKIIDLVLESLKAVDELDYDMYELIVIDNGSTDGSAGVIKEFLSRLKVNSRFIRLDRNVGFAGACNIGFRASDPESRYVVLLNNDAIPYPDSLRRLVEEMEADESLGSAQGVVVDYDSGLIDTAGDMIDELLLSYLSMSGEDPGMVKGSAYVTYADGSYSIHRVEAVLRVNGKRELFPSELFAYFEDTLLGLRMWGGGFRVKSVPFITAKHRRSSSFKSYSSLQLYLGLRNYVALMKISNSRYRNLLTPYAVRVALSKVLRHGGHRGEMTYITLKALRNGDRLADKLRREGVSVDIYKAPVVRLESSEVLKGIILLRTLASTASFKLRDYWKGAKPQQVPSGLTH